VRAVCLGVVVGVIACGGNHPLGDGASSPLSAGNDGGSSSGAGSDGVPGDAGTDYDSGTPPALAFVDVAKSAGLPALGGMCMGFEDFDADGLPDMLLGTQSQQGVQQLVLYVNAGGGSFRAEPLLFQPSGMMGGCAVGDVDGDGLPDVAVSLFDEMRVHLLRNIGGDAFQEVSALAAPAAADAGAGPGVRQGFIAVGLADFDGDGQLDLVAAPYLQVPSPKTVDCKQTTDGFSCFVPAPRCLPPPVVFRNTGGGTFGAPVSVVDPGSCGPANANALAIVDYDGDGRPDVFVANDWGVNALYLQGPTPLQFTDLAPKLAIKGYNHAMGAAFADYDLDGNLDFYVSDLGSHQLYLGAGGGAVAPHGVDWGVAAATVFTSGWAPLADDLDDDGYTDVWVANSAVVQSYVELAAVGGGGPALAPRAQSDFAFHNRAGHGFDVRPVPQSVDASPQVAAGVTAAADYDGDGRLDLAETVGEPARFQLMHNVGPGGHWLDVRLRGHASNRDGIGAVVTVKQPSRPDVAKTVERTRGSIGASWAVAHFGLGSGATVDSVVVQWPSGIRQTIAAPATNRLLLVEEPTR